MLFFLFLGSNGKAEGSGVASVEVSGVSSWVRSRDDSGSCSDCGAPGGSRTSCGLFKLVDWLARVKPSLVCLWSDMVDALWLRINGVLTWCFSLGAKIFT